MFIEGKESLVPILEQSAEFFNKCVLDNSSYITGKTKGEWERIYNNLVDQ